MSQERLFESRMDLGRNIEKSMSKSKSVTAL